MLLGAIEQKCPIHQDGVMINRTENELGISASSLAQGLSYVLMKPQTSAGAPPGACTRQAGGNAICLACSRPDTEPLDSDDDNCVCAEVVAVLQGVRTGM
jgi:hypothetical protein